MIMNANGTGAQAVPGAAEAVTRTLDAAAVLKRRDYFTSNWQDDGQVKWAADTGIELIRGHGWITDIRKVEVAGLDGNSYALSARHAVVVATARAAVTLPPMKGRPFQIASVTVRPKPSLIDFWINAAECTWNAFTSTAPTLFMLLKM